MEAEVQGDEVVWSMTLTWQMEEIRSEPRYSDSAAIVPLPRKETPPYTCFPRPGLDGLPTSQILQSLIGYGRGVGLYSKGPGKSSSNF